MTTAAVLSPTTSVLSDRRDNGRALRVTWHGGDDLFVLSTWRDGVCASSFQLQRRDAPALISALVQGLAAPSAEWSTASYSLLPRRARIAHFVHRFRSDRHDAS